MKVLCAFWQYMYGDRERGIGIEYESFIPALKRLGHEVKHFETWDQDAHSTYEELNRAHLAEVDRFDPDIVFTVQRDYEIWTETLEAIRHRGKVALITWTTDDSFKFETVSKYIGTYYDAISTTYDYRVADYQKYGIDGVCFTQWAANSHWLNPPKRAQDCCYAVSFVGLAYSTRQELVEELKQAGIHTECFGHGWPNGPVAADQIPIIMRDSIISLNFCAGGRKSHDGNDRQIKARTFEVPGSGGFLLTDAAPGLDDFYRIGEEIAVYENFDDLVRKITYYLQNSEVRDQIAQAGYVRTSASHTYEQRLCALIDFGLERRDKRLQSPARIDLPSQGNTKESDPSPEFGIALCAIRWCLVTVCSMVWGAERGQRAARQLVFNVSRKICGIRTFGAKGIPGRMFPYV